MKLSDLGSGFAALGGALGASLCCVLPLSLALLGLGGGTVMAVTMPYRPVLYPLGLLAIGVSVWAYRRERRRCDAAACRMAGRRANATLIVAAALLMATVTYVDFFLTSL